MLLRLRPARSCRYLFDTRGVFTIPNALTLSHVDELNQVFSEVEEDPAWGGAGRMGGDALHWGRCYRELLDMPKISPILEELIGNHRQVHLGPSAPLPLCFSAPLPLCFSAPLPLCFSPPLPLCPSASLSASLLLCLSASLHLCSLPFCLSAS
eukprot:COSAG03_NODE_3590_length_1933_cov_35.680480_2_plen_153_part_00